MMFSAESCASIGCGPQRNWVRIRAAQRLRLGKQEAGAQLAATRRGFVYWHSVPAKGQRVGSLLKVIAAGSFEEKSANAFAAECASRRARCAALETVPSSSSERPECRKRRQHRKR